MYNKFLKRKKKGHFNDPYNDMSERFNVHFNDPYNDMSEKNKDNMEEQPKTMSSFFERNKAKEFSDEEKNDLEYLLPDDIKESQQPITEYKKIEGDQNQNKIWFEQNTPDNIDSEVPDGRLAFDNSEQPIEKIETASEHSESDHEARKDGSQSQSRSQSHSQSQSGSFDWVKERLFTKKDGEYHHKLEISYSGGGIRAEFACLVHAYRFTNSFIFQLSVMPAINFQGISGGGWCTYILSQAYDWAENVEDSVDIDEKYLQDLEKSIDGFNFTMDKSNKLNLKAGRLAIEDKLKGLDSDDKLKGLDSNITKDLKKKYEFKPISIFTYRSI